MPVQTPRLPDDAPFTPAERAWIDGFLAGLFGTPGTGATPETAASSAPAADAPEDFPWHDATLRIDERLQLAEGRPRVRRMMAAMGGRDCGPGGVRFQPHAEAIA